MHHHIAPPEEMPSRRRRLLGSLLALPALPLLDKLPIGLTHAVAAAPMSDDFVLIDGWILPASYFKD